MRTSITLSLVLLAAVLIGGWVCAQLTGGVSERYLSAAEELDVLTQDGHWLRAEETARAYMEDWEKTEKWLQILCNHEDTDAVSLSMKKVQSGVEAQDAAVCKEACWELRENAQHIFHRDALTWGNVL